MSDPSIARASVLTSSLQAGNDVNGQLFLPMDGHKKCPLVASKTARLWPIDLPTDWFRRDWPSLGWSVQAGDSFSGEGLGEADGIAAGLADVGVVQQSVNGGGGEGFGHELVESGGVEV